MPTEKCLHNTYVTQVFRLHSRRDPVSTLAQSSASCHTPTREAGVWRRSHTNAMVPPKTFGGVDSDGAVDKAFWAWALAQGVEAVACAPALFQEGWRGIAATADIAPGDVVLRVPGALLMSARSAARDPDLATALETHGAALDPAERLSCHLLHEASKGTRSTWHRYVSQLPRQYNLLSSWTAAERDALQAPHAINTAERAGRATLTSHARALETLEALSLPKPFRSSAAWTWATSTVSSRTVFVPFDQAGALCPVGDLFNYAPPAPPAPPQVLGTPLGSLEDGEADVKAGGGMCDSPDDSEKADPDATGVTTGEEALEASLSSGDGEYDVSSDTYRFHARRSYKQGEQIMLCYGKHSNLGLLEHYGFLLPPFSANANDVAPISSLVLFARDENGLEKGAIEDLDAMDVDDGPMVSACGSLSWNDVVRIRSEAASKDGDVRRLGVGSLKRARDVAARGKSISPATELRAFEAVRDAAGRTLLGLPTTAKDDEMALREGIESCFQRREARARAADASSAEGSAERLASPSKEVELDDHGAPLEWTIESGDAHASCDVDDSNVWLAVRWRLAYKRLAQAAYRLAQARVDEASEALRGTTKGSLGRRSSRSGRESTKDARVAQPRVRAK